ncbi:putative permease YjgP/YjgQ family protein [Aquisphaera giovannonii]|uniref:Putative permease YjgP/YjgQ family protein n=1 Tax=Aquisphaera giovannonii TaxID=406548 RepID=A0A5B9W0H0_9BACT|nr:LptF/LptG family permease [Aquisphaera giovannonii]QEH33704.1 putative permease YjgP/YjgQ family protein [Aquisphaera giovannonii]
MKILQRYVCGEVLRSFLLSLLTMSAIFVLFMVAAEAMRSKLLTPSDIAELVPYVIPSTLPYTIPVSLLFSVTVVYGRIAGDNEVIAVKASGLSVMTVIWPTLFLAAALSGVLIYVSRGWIPISAHNAKMVIFKDVEDTFYKLLKRDREFNNRDWPFFIKVKDVEGRVMHDAIFKKRAKRKDNSDTFSAAVHARSAEMHFDFENRMVRVTLDKAEVQNYGEKEEDVMLINDEVLEIPMPQDNKKAMQRAVQEYTNAEIDAELMESRKKLESDRKREAIRTAFQFATGRYDEVAWASVQRAQVESTYYKRRINELETEKQQRTSMALGSLLFAILGTPVGILFAKRDFLSAFISCFVPIITVYYPLILFGVNMGKEGTMEPWKALWIGNLVLGVLAVWVYPRVIKY